MIESKKDIDNEIRKLRKKDSYNKKALEISKEVIQNLSLELESFRLYTYDQILETLAEKMKIDMDFSIFLDVVEALKKEGFLDTHSAIHFLD